MLKVLFHILFYILFFLMGFTLTLGIMGGVLCSLQKHSSKLQIIGELFIFGIHIRNNLHSGSHSYNSYN